MLHGKFGEDGRVQAILETYGIPYSGCGVLAGGLGVDKDISKQILRYHNIEQLIGSLLSQLKKSIMTKSEKNWLPSNG